MPTIERFLDEDDLLPRRTAGGALGRRAKQRVGPTSKLADRPEPSRRHLGFLKLHLRQVVGLVLIALSLMGGYLTIVGADQRVTVLALSHEISAGQAIQFSDLVEIKAAVPQGLYATSKSEVVGQALSRASSAGELLALSQVIKSDQLQLIAVPIKSINLPAMTRGSQVALWSNGELIASGLRVEEITRESTYQVLTLAVPDDEVTSVVASLSGEVTVVKLP